mmetsp:Transcript_33494/g.95293  ORF Transcript_33494/g.95293 Transcript_33494/m.95293 type:complete len:152 (-) Transcript_33494:1061-1516(-)
MPASVEAVNYRPALRGSRPGKPAGTPLHSAFGNTLFIATLETTTAPHLMEISIEVYERDGAARALGPHWTDRLPSRCHQPSLLKRNVGTTLSKRMPHEPQTQTFSGPPLHAVPAAGSVSQPQKSFSSFADRRRMRTNPLSPQKGPHEFWIW